MVFVRFRVQISIETKIENTHTTNHETKDKDVILSELACTKTCINSIYADNKETSTNVLPRDGLNPRPPTRLGFDTLINN